MISIYVPQVNNRIRYTFDVIFKSILQSEYTLTSDEKGFKKETGVKISYANQPVGTELFFFATPLLFEKKVKEQSIEVFESKEGKAFFKTNDKSALPYDPFATSFYLITRYEEYLPHYKDQLGRFPAAESLAIKNDFLQTPLIDIWSLKIKELIISTYPRSKGLFKDRAYSFCPTYDIDSAYAYSSKGIVRNIGGYAKALLDGNVTEISERTKVLLHSQKDPFDSYEYLLNLQNKYQLKPIYFFLVGDYGEYDKNISYRDPQFQELIKSTADYAEIGIHPSYASNSDFTVLTKEIKRLSEILKREPKKSRQHFLKLEIPKTYQNLLHSDVLEDFSMGYASNIGFRASTATPFYFYNLDLEMPTSLKVNPFSIMDATFQFYLKVSPEEALELTKPIIETVKSVNATFSTLFHNNTLGDTSAGKRWRWLYEEIIKLAL